MKISLKNLDNNLVKDLFWKHMSVGDEEITNWTKINVRLLRHISCTALLATHLRSHVGSHNGTSPQCLGKYQNVPKMSVQGTAMITTTIQSKTIQRTPNNTNNLSADGTIIWIKSAMINYLIDVIAFHRTQSII